MDNLNPLFLYPDMSKQVDLFTALMQALSRHLRPAPYPYGLLTLRLLGKLGGKNREFLREPLLICQPKSTSNPVAFPLECSWDVTGNGSESLYKFTVPLPVSRCVEILRILPSAPFVPTPQKITEATDADDEKPTVTLLWADHSKLWTENIAHIDLDCYNVDVMNMTCERQAAACVTILETAATWAMQRSSSGNVQASEETELFLGLLYASAIESTKEHAKALLRESTTKCGNAVSIRKSIVQFLKEKARKSCAVGLEYIQFLVSNVDETFDKSLLVDLLSDLCAACASTNWGERRGIMEAICFLIEKMGRAWSRENEVALISTGLMAVKVTPREVSSACVECLQFFFRVCTCLYGIPWKRNDEAETRLLFDTLEPIDDLLSTGPDDDTDEAVSKAKDGAGPCEEVCKLMMLELASQQHAVR